MFMSSAEYRESLRRYSPRVFLNGEAVDSVADDRGSDRASRPSASATISRAIRRTRL
jgi:hypothetical protein